MNILSGLAEARAARIARQEEEAERQKDDAKTARIIELEGELTACKQACEALETRCAEAAFAGQIALGAVGMHRMESERLRGELDGQRRMLEEAREMHGKAVGQYEEMRDRAFAAEQRHHDLVAEQSAIAAVPVPAGSSKPPIVIHRHISGPPPPPKAWIVKVHQRDGMGKTKSLRIVPEE